MNSCKCGFVSYDELTEIWTTSDTEEAVFWRFCPECATELPGKFNAGDPHRRADNAPAD